VDTRVVEFDAQWCSIWGEDAQPIGWWLLGIEAWCRFHMLPGSKRYPDSEAEMQVILNRHVTLVSEIIEGGDTDLIIIAQQWGDDDFSPRWIEGTLPQALRWREMVLDEELHNLPEMWISFGPHTVDDLLPLLRAVAETGMHFAVTDSSLGWLYAPYDGGADIFYRDVAEEDAARQKHADWLPQNGRGL
jgi:hypothetical protein